MISEGSTLYEAILGLIEPVDFIYKWIQMLIQHVQQAMKLRDTEKYIVMRAKI